MLQRSQFAATCSSGAFWPSWSWPEVGRRRVPVSLLAQIAETLTVSLEELIGKKDVQPAKRGPAPKLQQQIERTQRLPRSKQRFVMQMLDTVLAQQSR
jgi:hypothetical protein